MQSLLMMDGVVEVTRTQRELENLDEASRIDALSSGSAPNERRFSFRDPCKNEVSRTLRASSQPSDRPPRSRGERSLGTECASFLPSSVLAEPQEAWFGGDSASAAVVAAGGISSIKDSVSRVDAAGAHPALFDPSACLVNTENASGTTAETRGFLREGSFQNRSGGAPCAAQAAQPENCVSPKVDCAASASAGTSVTRRPLLEVSSRQSTDGSPTEVSRSRPAPRLRASFAAASPSPLSGASSSLARLAEESPALRLFAAMQSLEELHDAEASTSLAPPVDGAVAATPVASPHSGVGAPEEDCAGGSGGAESCLMGSARTGVSPAEAEEGPNCWRKSPPRESPSVPGGGEEDPSSGSVKDDKSGDDRRLEEREEDGEDAAASVKRRKKDDDDDRFSALTSSPSFPAPSPPSSSSSPSQVNPAQEAPVSSPHHPSPGFEEDGPQTRGPVPAWVAVQAAPGAREDDQTDKGSDSAAASMSPGQPSPGPARGAAVGPGAGARAGSVAVAGEKYAQWLDAIYTVCLKIDDLCAKLDPDFPNAMALWEQRGPGIDGARSLFMNGGCPPSGCGGVDLSQRGFDGAGDLQPPFGGVDDYGAGPASSMYSSMGRGAGLGAGNEWNAGGGSLKKRSRKDRPSASSSRPGGNGATSSSSLLSSSLLSSSLLNSRGGGSGGGNLLLPLGGQAGPGHLGAGGGASLLLHQLQGRDNSQLLLGGAALPNDVFASGSHGPPHHQGAGPNPSAAAGASPHGGGGGATRGGHGGMMGPAGGGGGGGNAPMASHYLPSHQLVGAGGGGRDRADPGPASSPESEYEYLLHLPEQEGPNPENATDLKCDVAGVYWDKRSWIASWYEGGKRYYKSFSAKTHGFYRSKYWAIKVRLSKVQNSNLLVNKGSKAKGERGGAAAAHAAAHAAAGSYGGRNAQADETGGYCSAGGRGPSGTTG